MCFRNGHVTVSAAPLCSVPGKSEPPSTSCAQPSARPSGSGSLGRSCPAVSQLRGVRATRCRQPEKPEPGWSSPCPWQGQPSVWTWDNKQRAPNAAGAHGPQLCKFSGWRRKHVQSPEALPDPKESRVASGLGLSLCSLLPARQPWASSLTSLSLSYLICEIRILTLSTPKD